MLLVFCCAIVFAIATVQASFPKISFTRFENESVPEDFDVYSEVHPIPVSQFHILGTAGVTLRCGHYLDEKKLADDKSSITKNSAAFAEMLLKMLRDQQKYIAILRAQIEWYKLEKVVKFQPCGFLAYCKAVTDDSPVHEGLVSFPKNAYIERPMKFLDNMLKRIQNFTEVANQLKLKCTKDYKLLVTEIFGTITTYLTVYQNHKLCQFNLYMLQLNYMLDNYPQGSENFYKHYTQQLSEKEARTAIYNLKKGADDVLMENIYVYTSYCYSFRDIEDKIVDFARSNNDAALEKKIKRIVEEEWERLNTLSNNATWNSSENDKLVAKKISNITAHDCKIF